jgi:hypothetical protein
VAHWYTLDILQILQIVLRQLKWYDFARICPEEKLWNFILKQPGIIILHSLVDLCRVTSNGEYLGHLVNRLAVCGIKERLPIMVQFCGRQSADDLILHKELYKDVVVDDGFAEVKLSNIYCARVSTASLSVMSWRGWGLDSGSFFSTRASLRQRTGPKTLTGLSSIFDSRKDHCVSLSRPIALNEPIEMESEQQSPDPPEEILQLREQFQFSRIVPAQAERLVSLCSPISTTPDPSRLITMFFMDDCRRRQRAISQYAVR